MGFRYILDGWNAERILIAARVHRRRPLVRRAGLGVRVERVVFGRPIGANQGVQFPIAQAHAAIEAADLMRCEGGVAVRRAAQPCGAEANMAKLLASEASWEAANACLDTHGGYGFAGGVRRRAQVPRDAPLPGRADQQQPGAGLRRPARAGHAAVVLTHDYRLGLARAVRLARHGAARAIARGRPVDRAGGSRRIAGHQAPPAQPGRCQRIAGRAGADRAPARAAARRWSECTRRRISTASTP